MTVPLYYKQLALALEICVQKIQTTCHRLSIPVMVATWCLSVWTPHPGVNWWQPLGVPSDSGRVWACCSADGPVIRRRDRQTCFFYSLTAPLWDCWLTGLLFLLKAVAHRQLQRKDYEYTVSVEQRGSGLVRLVPVALVRPLQSEKAQSRFSHCLANILNSTHRQVLHYVEPHLQVSHLNANITQTVKTAPIFSHSWSF